MDKTRFEEMNEEEIEELLIKVKEFCKGRDRNSLPPMSIILNQEFGITWHKDMQEWMNFVRTIAKEVWGEV